MKKKIVSKSAHLLLIVLAVTAIFPFIIMVFGSFKTAAEFSGNPAGFPLRPTLENYTRLFNYNSGIMVRAFFNSLFISTAYTVLTLLISSMAAFAFAKYNFKGKNWIFLMLLATMMIPIEVNIPPMYLLFSRINWLSTYYVQIFPQIANVFALFMAKQHIESIPDAIIESAVVDGAGNWKIYSRIIIPVSRPVLGALAILLFLNKWNEYMWPQIMVRKTQYLPISVILPSLNDKNSLQMIPWELVLTGCTIVTIPVLICFLMFQEKFIQSMTIGAVKE